MPTPGFNIGGARPSGAFRLRSGFFGAILEELIEYRDGSSRWVKADSPFQLNLAPPPLPPAKND